MVKRFLISLILSASILLISQSPTLAVGGNFTCEWSETFDKCLAPSNKVNCESGYSADISKCSSIQSPANCASAGPFDCESIGDVVGERCSMVVNEVSDKKPNGSYSVNLKINDGSLTKGKTYNLNLYYDTSGTLVKSFSPSDTGATIVTFLTPPSVTSGRLEVNSQLFADVGKVYCSANVTLPTSNNTPATSSLCNNDKGINTAIGCIPIESPSKFIGFIFRWAVGIGGGIAFLIMLYAGFVIMTSTGNPERLKGGQELLTSAITGLIMIIFSIFILRLIGVNILQIQGFQ